MIACSIFQILNIDLRSYCFYYNAISCFNQIFLSSSIKVEGDLAAINSNSFYRQHFTG